MAAPSVSAGVGSPSSSASQMAATVAKAWRRTISGEFINFRAITTKDYEADELQKPAEEQEKLKANRFEEYQKICFAGLGTVFWASATGVLSSQPNKQLNQESLDQWAQYSSRYAIVAVVLMLLGLCASTFPTSSLLAAGMAGLGGCMAVIFIVWTFLIASLKYYSNTEECFYHFLAASVVVISYWGFSAQDPLLLHIFVKLIWCVIKVAVIGVCFVLHHLFCRIMWMLSWVVWFFKASWGLFTCLGYLGNALLAVYNLNRTSTSLRASAAIGINH